MYFRTLEKKECCGCTACLSACPKQCISMVPDEEGFLYPVIDKNLCINCGLCEKVCPVNTPVYDNMNPAVYAAYVKDEKQRMQSTSGAIFYVIANWIIGQGGIVYGAAFDKDFKLKHIGVESLSELQSLRGSKYLQSDLGHTFSEIKGYLEKGRWVYFVGVGCQVAGLHSFLRKEYATLLTSDLVCHGVPSQLMFDWHLDYLRHKEKGEIVSYSFRDCKGWGVCETYKYVSQTSGKQRVRRLYSYSLSPYLYAFMYAFNYRYSCYDCKFAQIPRQGDITLADYWWFQEVRPEFNDNIGCSLVYVNSPMGEKLLEKINVIKQQTDDARDIKNGFLYSGAVSHSALAHKNRGLFFENVYSSNFSVLVFTLVKDSWYKRIFSHTKRVLRKNNRIMTLYKKHIKSILRK